VLFSELKELEYGEEFPGISKFAIFQVGFF
jgi:hypothetical protein